MDAPPTASSNTRDQVNVSSGMLLAERLYHNTSSRFDVGRLDRADMVAGRPPHRNLGAKLVPTKTSGMLSLSHSRSADRKKFTRPG